MNHQWKKEQTWGVTPGSGRPHGVDESWTCTRCGCAKGRGPQSNHKGNRVIRWHYHNANGDPVDHLPNCA